MTRDALRYLSNNTNITYFEQGSIARALVEATTLEISRLQDYVGTLADNTFLSTSSGIFLDLFGEMLGLSRITNRHALASIEDGAVRFYVDSGTLGSKLSNTPGEGLIPKGTVISNPDGSIQFEVTTPTSFPINARSAFVPIKATARGASFNIGSNQLTTHSLSDKTIKVTNDISITTGSDTETDSEYRFRLSKAFTTRFAANKTAIQIAATSQPGVSRAEIVSYARGAGTFDVLLIPVGNKLTKSAIDNTARAVEAVVAYGISPTIKEPTYVAFKVMGQLRFDASVQEGQRLGSKSAAESAVLQYFAGIPIGGEFIINQLRSAILSSSNAIKDVKIFELCLDGKPRLLSNIKLDRDELFTPDDTVEDSVKMI